MEIILYDDDLYIRTDFIHNTTRRERTPVSRTSDSNYGFSGVSIGNNLFSLECLVWSSFDGRFKFEEALKSPYYYPYDSIYIESAIYFVNPEDNTVDDIYTNLTIPFVVSSILPYMYSYDGKPYDIHQLLKDVVDQLGNTIENYDPNTFFISNVLVKSGFTEVNYDCSPTIIKVKKHSTIKFVHNISYETKHSLKVTKQSNIQLYDIFTIK